VVKRFLVFECQIRFNPLQINTGRKTRKTQINSELPQEFISLPVMAAYTIWVRLLLRPQKSLPPRQTCLHTAL